MFFRVSFLLFLWTLPDTNKWMDGWMDVLRNFMVNKNCKKQCSVAANIIYKHYRSPATETIQTSTHHNFGFLGER